MAASPPPVLTVAEVCELLRIHKSTVYRLIQTGKFPHFRIGTDYRFSREAIDKWRRAQEGQRTTARPRR